jgi:hypothetical protein
VRATAPPGSGVRLQDEHFWGAQMMEACFHAADHTSLSRRTDKLVRPFFVTDKRARPTERANVLIGTSQVGKRAHLLVGRQSLSVELVRLCIDFHHGMVIAIRAGSPTRGDFLSPFNTGEKAIAPSPFRR